MLLQTASTASDQEYSKIEVNYLIPFSLKSDSMRLMKSCHDEIIHLLQTAAILNSTSTAFISASEVKLVLGSLRDFVVFLYQGKIKIGFS